MDSHESEQQNLNLDQAEFEEAVEGPPSCAVCSENLFGTYYEINSKPTCERCRYKLEEDLQSGTASGRFFRALGAGVAAGMVGAGIYYGVLAITGYHVGLVAIVVGWLVGKGVHWGCAARGGWVYQGMAVTITYLAIVSTFVPQIIEEIRELDFDELAAEAPAEAGATPELPTGPSHEASAPAEAADPVMTDSAADADMEPVLDMPTPVATVLAIVLLAVLAMAAPFLSGSIIGLIIIGVGLYEAWRQNKKLVLVIEGPFQLSLRQPGGGGEEMDPEEGS